MLWQKLARTVLVVAYVVHMSQKRALLNQRQYVASSPGSASAAAGPSYKDTESLLEDV